MTYNGWTNKETWLVNLWLGDFFQEQSDDGVTIDADYIESTVDEMIELDCTGFIRDLLNCAVYEINYQELASHYEPIE